MSSIRPEVTGRKLPQLSALDLEKHVSVPEAAKIRGISTDTFKRHYQHLIRKVSPRREGVKLRDLLQENTRKKESRAARTRLFVCS
jgi:hypothetical protein